MQAHTPGRATRIPDVLVGEAEQQGELARPCRLLNDHRRGDRPVSWGWPEAHQGFLAGELQGGTQSESLARVSSALLLQDCAAGRRFLPQPLAAVLINLKGFPRATSLTGPLSVSLLRMFQDCGLRRRADEGCQVAAKLRSTSCLACQLIALQK